LLVVFILLLAQASQQPPRDTKAVVAGSAVLAGRVVDAETGDPIPRAMVQIVGKVDVRSTDVEANDRGEFRLEGLGAGDYTVVASPPELRASHLSQVFGGEMSSLMMRATRPVVTLQPGEKRADLVIRLPRALALDGIVLDDSGQTMAGVRVSAEFVQGLPYGDSREQTSDDRGKFRLFGLSPGEYRICATPEQYFQMGQPSSGYAVERRYVKTCYPSAPAGGGERVTVGRNVPAPMLTIVMQRSSGVTLSGRAISESGAGNISVSISSAAPMESTSVPVEMQGDRRFVARGVTPGRYHISAFAGSRPTGPDSSVNTERGRVTVEVADTDVTGINITASKGATLLGRIVPAEPLPPRTTLRVNQSAMLGLARFLSMATTAPVREDLTFQMAGVHGEILFEVSGLPPGWVVSGVRYRGTDVTDTATTVASTVDPSQLEIHVSPHSGRVVPRAVGEDGQPAKAATVVVLTATGERVISPTAEPKTITDGFEIGPLRPGEYIVAALAFTDLLQVMRRSVGIAGLREIGRRVRVTVGEPQLVDVVVKPLPEVVR
jgi:hypothetical protein